MSDMKFLQEESQWCQAPVATREAFKAAMGRRRYGPEETLDAWLWFLDGYKAGVMRVVTVCQEIAP